MILSKIRLKNVIQTLSTASTISKQSHSIIVADWIKYRAIDGCTGESRRVTQNKINPPWSGRSRCSRKRAAGGYRCLRDTSSPGRPISPGAAAFRTRAGSSGLRPARTPLAGSLSLIAAAVSPRAPPLRRRHGDGREESPFTSKQIK